MRKWMFMLAALSAIFVGWGCGGSVESAKRFAYVLNNPGSLSTVNLLTGVTVAGPIALDGNLRNIAVRPTDGKLFAIGTDLKLYEVNPSNGDCTEVNANPLAIDGHNGGMTFVPNTATIRFMSILANNYQINSNTGVVTATDTDVTEAVAGLAVRTSPSTEYFIYSSSDEIYKTSNPASGALTLVGATDVDLSGGAGMAIDQETGFAYVVAHEGLFSASLSNGHLTSISSNSYDDIAIIP